MRALYVLIVAVVACAPREEEDRALRVADADDPPPTGSDDDTGGPASGDPVDGCGGDDGWAEIDASLDVTWCARLTPEYGSITDEVTDTGVVLDTGVLHPPVPPPCGFTNLVGSIGLAGSAAAPTVLYCDSDPDGGMRFARFDPADGGVESDTLAALDCSPVPSSGSIVPDGEGYLAAWSGLSGSYSDGAGSGSGTPGVVAVRLGADGAIVEGPVRTGLDASVNLVDIAAGASPVAAAVDFEGNLWLAPMDYGLFAPDPTLLATGVSGVAILPFEDGFVVASCAVDDGPLTLYRLDATLETVASSTLSNSACGWFARPALAAGHGGVSVGWEGALGAAVVRLDGSLQELWRYDLDGKAQAPQPVEYGDGWLVFSEDGALARLDDAGQVQATAWHPGVVDAEGSVDDLRLLVDGDQAVFLVFGMDSYPIGGGHVNTYNYVEISSAPIP